MTVRLLGTELDTMYNSRVAISAEVSVTATSSATANACMTTGAFSIANGGYYLVEVFTPYLTKGTTNLDVELWDGATFLTSLSGHMAASMTRPGTVMRAFVSLATGNHNLTVKAFVDAGTGKFGAGDGATGDAPNALLTVSPA